MKLTASQQISSSVKGSSTSVHSLVKNAGTEVRDKPTASPDALNMLGVYIISHNNELIN